MTWGVLRNDIRVPRHSCEGRNPQGCGEVYAPFACVRGRERAERCERGMDGEVCGGGQQLAEHPLNPLRLRKGEIPRYARNDMGASE